MDIEQMTIPSIKKVLTAAVLVGLTSSAMAETTEEWGHRVLNLQANLDLTVPLAQSMWVGTHNSFANPQNDSLWDYNQPYSLDNQLSKGVRELVFDVHWYNSQMVVCHNNSNEACLDGTTGNRKLTNSLDDIKQWLNKDENRNQVIMLKIEMTDAARRNINKIESKIEGSMGSYVYGPNVESTHGDLNSSTGCTALPSSTLTKKDVLDAGKNVIIYNTHGCISDGGFNDLSFYGDNNLDNENAVYKLEAWSDSKSATVMSRVKDAMTRDKSYMTTATNVKMQPNNVEDWMRAGLNIFELYGFDANDSRWNKDGEQTIQAEHMVWSWNNKEPNDYGSGEDCAMITSNGKMNDWVCSNQIAYACYTATTGWTKTVATGKWSDGAAACSNEGSVFSVPTNLVELDKLNTVRGSDYVWVNYSDAVIEDEWIANTPANWLNDNDNEKSTLLGGSGGSAFDDFDLLKRDLYRNNRKITKINMSAGSRVDKVGFEYSDGHSVSHGGNGYDRSLTINQSNEYISKVEVCTSKKNGSYRIFYLRFETNYGDALSGGSRTGTCKTHSKSGYEVFAMYGREGGELDAVGFYLRAR